MKKTFMDGIALGVFLTLLAISILALLFDIRIFGQNSDGYIQTFLTSSVAIGAAYLALRGIRDQIQQNFEIEERRRLQSLRAARATLPLALSELLSVAREVLGKIFDGTAVSHDQLVKSVSSPTILGTLSKCIEFSDEKSSDRLAQIIRYIQLVQARFDEKYFIDPYPPQEHDWIKSGHSRTSYIVDWAVLAAICNSAFYFARGSTPNIPPTLNLQEVYNAIASIGILAEEYPLLIELMATRSKQDRLERDFGRP